MSTQLTIVPSPVDAFGSTLDGVIATAPNGETAPITDCAWVQIAPCGCPSGITMCQHGPETYLMTAEAALRDMAGTAADYREDVKRGVRMVLIRMAEYRSDVVNMMTSRCPHTPKWGYELPTRQVGERTWRRIRTTTWRHTDEHGEWVLEKWSGYWHVSPPSVFMTVGQTRSIPSMGSMLDEAFTRAAAYIAELAAEASA